MVGFAMKKHSNDEIISELLILAAFLALALLPLLFDKTG